VTDLDGLKPGPRDHLITRALERLLQELGAEFRHEIPRDAAEGPELVADNEGWAQAEVVVPARVLSGIKARSSLGQPVELPPLPATPFSQSDLLVNAEGAAEYRLRAQG
jgi:hypothetical protein